jgi:putative lipoic acid-binding regulatory protein
MSSPKQPLLTFPCSFPIKVIGKDVEEFELFVIQTVSKYIGTINREAVTSRPSAGGKYTSVTITFIAENQEQIDSIYLELSNHERVLMVL